MADIERYGVTPRWSDRVVHRGVVYLVEVAATPGAPFDQQVAEVFASVERQLAEAGSSHERLLQVTVYLADLDRLPRFNELWEQWIPDGCAPSRACLRADLADPGFAVELVVQAAV